MLGRDHALSGALAFAAIAPLLHPGGPGLAAGIAVTAGAGLWPDFDEPQSTIARTAGFLTGAFSRFVRAVSGGHRKGSHSLTGTAVFTAAAWAAAANSASWPGRVAVGVLLAVLLSAAFRALRLGGHHGDMLGIGAAAAMTGWHAGLHLVPLCVAAGALAHIAGDMITRHGCPVLYPFSHRDFGLLPASMRISTDKLAEHVIVTPLLLLALGYLTWRDASALPAVHAHLTGHLAR